MTADRTTSSSTKPEPLGARFRALLASATLTNLADGVVQTGIPLYAVTLTRSPGQIALITAAAWLPWLVLGIPAGVVVDRHDRRTVQVVALCARVAILLAGSGLAVAGLLPVPALIALVLAYGVTDVLVDLAQSALVPGVVPRSRLQAANGRMVAVQQVAASFVGAPLGGVILALGAGWVLGLPAALVVVAALLLRAVPRARPAATGLPQPGTAVDDGPAQAPAPVPGRRSLAEVREGVGFLVRHPVLRPLLVAGSVANMCFTGYTAVLVLWVVGDDSRVGMSAAQYPLLGAALAVGAIGGALTVERLMRVAGELRLMLGCWAVMSLMLLVPVLVPRPIAIGASFFLLGLTNTVANVLSQSMRQRLVPAGMLGRVGGASRTLAFGLMPLGAALAGVVAEAVGLAPVLTGAAMLSLVGLAYPMARVRQTMVTAADTERVEPVNGGAEAPVDDASEGCAAVAASR
ncbi:MAG TPA: MFS transporter [Propionicimonas sp.]